MAGWLVSLGMDGTFADMSISGYCPWWDIDILGSLGSLAGWELCFGLGGNIKGYIEYHEPG